MLNIMVIETIEWYCTILSHLETYIDLYHKVSKSFSCGKINIIAEGDILYVLIVPNTHFRLPGFSVGEGLYL